MKVFSRIILAALFLSTASIAAPKYGDRQYSIKVYDQQAAKERSSDSAIESGVLVFVYTAGTKTLATIYKDANRTALANPISRADFAAAKGIKFYGTANSYDLFLAGVDGSTGSFKGVTPFKHSLSLDTVGVSKHLVIPFEPSDNTEIDTGIDLPKDSIVRDAGLYVSTADSTETLDVGLLSSGTGGDADGFITGASVGSPGWVAMAAGTVGGTESYLSAVSYGPLLGTFLAGANSAGDVGTYLLFGHKVTGANTGRVTYTGSSGSDTAAGYIHLWFDIVR